MVVGLGARGLAASALVFLVANLTVKAGYAASVLLLASLLPPEDYAAYGMLYALQVAATTLSVTGLIEITAGRLRHASDGDHKPLFAQMSGLFVLISAFTVALLLPVAAIFFWPKGEGVAALSAVALGVVTGFGALQASFQRIEERHFMSVVFGAGVPLAALLGILCAAIWLRELWAVFLFGGVFAALIFAALLVSRDLPSASIPSRVDAQKALHEIWPFGMVGLFAWLGGYGMTFAIEWRFAPVAVATYTFLYTLAALGQVAANSLNMVWSPRFYRLHNSGEHAAAEKQSHRFFGAEALILGAAGFIAVFALPYVCDLVGGHLVVYGQYRLQLAMLLSAYVVSIPAWHAQNYYLVSGAGTRLMRMSIWAGVFGTALWIGGFLLFGEIAIFVGYVLQVALRSVILWRDACTTWQLSLPWSLLALSSALPFFALAMPA